MDFVPRTDMAGQPKYRMRRKCSISRLGSSGPLKLVKSIWPDSSNDVEGGDKQTPDQQVKRVNRKSILEIITGLRKSPQHNIQLSANDFQLKQTSSSAKLVSGSQSSTSSTDCQTSSVSAALQTTPPQTRGVSRTSSRSSANKDNLATQKPATSPKPVINQNNLQQISVKELQRNNTQTVYVQCDLHNPYLSFRRGRSLPKDDQNRNKDGVGEVVISDKFEEYARVSKVSKSDIASEPAKDEIEIEDAEESNKFKKKRNKFQTFPRIFMRYFDSSIEEVDVESDDHGSLREIKPDIHREKGNKKRDLSNFLNMFKKADDSTQPTNKPAVESVKPTPAKRKIKYPPKPAITTSSSQARLTESQVGDSSECEADTPERPPPPRPPKMPLKNPKRLVNDVYTQVVNIRKEAKLRKQSNIAVAVTREQGSPLPGASKVLPDSPRSRNLSVAQDSCFYRNDYMPPLRSAKSREELAEASCFYEPVNVPPEEEVSTTYHRLETPRNSQFRGTKMIATFFNTMKNLKLK